jgi:protein O-GlcNAc transferase
MFASRHLNKNAQCVFVLALLWVACLGVSAPMARETPDDFLSQGDQLTQTENFSAAEQVYREALAAFPGHLEILKRLGVIYQTQLRFQESVVTFQDVLARESKYPEVNFYLGLSYLGMNSFEKAVGSFKQELLLNPKYRRARYYLSVAYQALKQPVDALQQLHMLNAEDPDDSQVLYELTRVHQTLSMQALNRLSRVAPESDLFLALKAEMLAKSEKYEEAINVYQAVRQRSAKFPGIRFALGEIYWKTLKSKEAESELRLALEEDPNHPLANYYLAELLLRNQQAHEALPLLKIAIAADPGFALAHFQLGKCYTAQGRWREALAPLLKAAELDPDSKMTHYQLARVYLQLKDPEQQKHHLKLFQELEQQDKQKALKESQRLQLQNPAASP